VAKTYSGVVTSWHSNSSTCEKRTVQKIRWQTFKKKTDDFINVSEQTSGDTLVAGGSCSLKLLETWRQSFILEIQSEL